MIKNIVLVGASNNPEKYGNKILKDLIGKGYTVYPINPKDEKIEGIKTYKNLGVFFENKKDYDVVNFVIKPEITLSILEKNKDILKNKKIWCQPGASDDDVVRFLLENDFKDYIVNSCIMLEDLTKK